MQKNRRKNGFTLIELIVVISIIGILVLLATPKFIEHTQEAKLAQIKHDVKVVETVLDEYLIKNKSLPETLQEFDYSTALAEDRVYGKTGLITNLEGTYVDVTDMDEVKAINSKLKGKFIANDKGEAYYVSDDKIIGKDDNSSEEVASGQVKDVFAVISMIDNSPVLSGMTIMEDGNVLELTPSDDIFSPEFLSSPSFTKTKIEELSGKNITNILTPYISIDSMKPTWVSGAMDSVYAISENGEVYVRGLNSYGELGLGHFNPSFSFTKNENLSNLKLDKISLGPDWAIGVKNGTVYGWGNNDFNQAVPYVLSFNDYSLMNIPQIVNSPFEHINTYSFDQSTTQFNGKWYPTGNLGFYFVSDDNVLYGVGSDFLTDILGYDFGYMDQDIIPNTLKQLKEFDEEIKEIISAKYNSLILTESGKIYSLGNNEYGQLGLGDTTRRTVPTEIVFFTNNNVQIKNIYTSGASVFVTTTDDKLYVWGRNSSGQLGFGDTTNINTPTELTFFRNKPIKDIQISPSSTFILTEDGKLYGFGSNNYGQLGLKDYTNRTIPTEIVYFTNNNLQIKNLYTNGASVFVTTTDNKVYVWGNNEFDQLGLGSSANNYVNEPTELTFFSGMQIKHIQTYDISTFDESTFVLTENGELYSFGYNDSGQLGLGHNDDESTPQLVNVNGELIEKINVNKDKVMVQTKNNNFYKWGNWDFDGIWTPKQINSINSLNPVAWGIATDSNPWEYDDPFIYVIDSNNVLYSIKSDIKGDEEDTPMWQIEQVSPFVKINDYNVKSVFIGKATSYITTHDNKVYRTNGDYAYLQSTQMYPLYYEEPALAGLDIKEIKGDSDSLLILTENGDLYVFKTDSKLLHQIGSNFNEIYGNSIGKQNNTLVAFYQDFFTEDFIVEPIEFNINVEMEKITGDIVSGFILSTDGKLYFYLNELLFSDNYEYIDELPSLNKFRLTEIDMTSVENNESDEEENDDSENSQLTVDKFATTEQSSYLLINNNAYGFGSNIYGELGLGDEIDRYSPTLISSLQDKNIVKIVGGYGYAFAISENGDVYAFGRNDSGELGLGDYTNVSTPVKNTMLSNFTSKDIKTGSSYSLLLEKGKLYAWGYNRSGRLGLGHEINMDSPTEVRFFSDNNIKIKNVYVGKMHNFVTTTDNKLYVWGSNHFGQLGLGDNADETYSRPTELEFFRGILIKDIKTNYYSTFVLTENGELYSFGYNDDGQLGLGHYDDVNTPQSVNVGGKTVDKIITGESSIIAITTDGDIYGWGSNEYYELGGSSQYIATPERLSHIEDLNPINIKMGSSHTIIETQSGDIYGLGANYFGQLGLGHNNYPIDTPTKLDLSSIEIK